MTPQELKNSILQLAVQGKLVEQQPEEGTAEELYQQIQDEKQRLIKKGKLKKEKPLPEIAEDEMPFDIPENWKCVRLGDFCVDIFSGKSPVYSKTETPYKVIGQAANQQAGLDLNQIKYTVATFWDDMDERYFLRKYDVLLNTLGNGTLGRSGYVSNDVEPLLTDGHLFVFRLLDEVSSKFCYYYLQSRKAEIEKSANGSTNQTFLSLRSCIRWVITLPPLAEQKRIVAKIEELLPYIDRYEQAWSRLETFNKRFPDDMKKSILQLAIQGKLVEQRLEEGTAEELYRQIQVEKQQLIKAGEIKKEKPLPEIAEDEMPFEIPESWKWVRLGSLMQFQGGYAFKSSTYVPISNNQVIRLGNVKPNNLLLDEKQVFIPDEIASVAIDYKLKENDILVTMTGTRKKRDYFFTLAVSAENIAEHNLFLNQRVGCLRSYGYMDINYLLCVLQNESIKDLIFTKETGTANQGNIGSEDMKYSILVPLPPLSEQKRIVAKLEELLPLCERLK